MLLLWLTHTTGIRVTELALLEVADVLYQAGIVAQWQTLTCSKGSGRDW